MANKSLIWSALLATAMFTGCGGTDPCLDADGDLAYVTDPSQDETCDEPVIDCDDSNSDIAPDVQEICGNGIDDDCSGAEDDDDACILEPCDPDNPNYNVPDTIDEACEAVLTTGEYTQLNEAIETAGDRDFWSIEAKQGNWYILWAERRGIDPGSPDTVLRVYGEDKTMIAENDDMPYRMKDTDAAHLFQAVADETLYIEVLEWSDWADDGAVGDPSYTYRMSIFEGDIQENLADNDSADAVSASEDPSWSLFPFSDSWPYWGAGVIDPAGDVDFYPVDFLSEDSLCQFGFWPDSPSLINPQLDVYWEDCTPATDTDPGDCDGLGVELLATTNTPETTPTGTFLSEDAGITAYIPRGAYYAKVSDVDGMGGVGYFYNLMASCYLTDWFEKELEDGNNTPLSNTPVSMDESASVAGRYFGTFFGERQVLSEGTDDMDTFKISNALGSGKYMTVNLEAANVGSIVGDIKMTFWEQTGDTYKELATVTSDNPQIRDHVLANEVAVYVTLEYQGSYSGLASQYFGTVIVSDTPVYGD